MALQLHWWHSPLCPRLQSSWCHCPASAPTRALGLGLGSGGSRSACTQTVFLQSLAAASWGSDLEQAAVSVPTAPKARASPRTPTPTGRCWRQSTAPPDEHTFSALANWTMTKPCLTKTPLLSSPLPRSLQRMLSVP